MSDKTEKIKKRYNRFAKIYDSLEEGIEKRWFGNWRKEMIAPLKGKILEIGVGTGKNLEYYSNDAEVVGIDFSPKMLEKAHQKLEKLGKKNIVIKEMDVESLDFPDNSFDIVITSFVWCSVPNPQRGLQEAFRVLKHGGQGIFMEHVRSRYFLIRLFQELHNPITTCLFGFNVNRDTLKNILSAGFKIIDDQKLKLWDVFRRFYTKK